MSARLAVIGLGLMLAACGPSVSDICETLEEECDAPLDECNRDGETLEARSASAGCEDAFDEYLGCVDDAVCSWANRCSPERQKLEACAGSFP